MGAELFHADGRTDTTKLIVAFRSFADVLKTALRSVSWVSFGRSRALL